MKYNSHVFSLLKKQRARRGATTLALILISAFFIILPLGLLGFEYARYTLLCQQLQSVTDAAALSGTAALASSPAGYTYTDLHNLAMTVAVQTFEQNSVLTTSFGGGNVVANQNSGTNLANPPLHTAYLNITLLDQNGNAVATDSKDAVTMQIQSIYSDRPVFASGILPIGNIETASAMSDGGLPQLDLFLCFDVSGSMDDQTPIALINRQWNPAINSVDYKTIASGNTIYDTFQPQPTGTALNAMPPQMLSYGSYGAPSNSTPYIFSESPYPAGNALVGMRGNQFTYAAGSIPGLPTATQYPPGSLVPEQGWPPGNFDPTNTLNANGNGKNPNVYANGFTDMVVPVPSIGGYDFSNMATCVEASRGNMENDAICLQSQGGKQEEAAEIYRRLWLSGGNSPSFAADAQELASIYTDMGAFASAIESYQKILQYDRKRLSPQDPSIGRDLNNLGQCYYTAACGTADPKLRRQYFVWAKEQLALAEQTAGGATISQRAKADQSIIQANRSLVQMDLVHN